MSIEDDASGFNRLLNDFVEETDGVTDAVAVSPDGLLLARSESLDDAGADQAAAIISGFVSLGHGAVRCFAFGELTQIVVAMGGGHLFVSAVPDGASTAGRGGTSCLGVVTGPHGDAGEIGYRTALLVERCGEMLSPELVTELKAQALALAR
jgi:predicted regulator of Ras-like GTPase activity (Roadblock/LC7/MglB family)